MFNYICVFSLIIIYMQLIIDPTIGLIGTSNRDPLTTWWNKQEKKTIESHFLLLLLYLISKFDLISCSTIFMRSFTFALVELTNLVCLDSFLLIFPCSFQTFLFFFYYFIHSFDNFHLCSVLPFYDIIV